MDGTIRPLCLEGTNLCILHHHGDGVGIRCAPPAASCKVRNISGARHRWPNTYVVVSSEHYFDYDRSVFRGTAREIAYVVRRLSGAPRTLNKQSPYFDDAEYKVAYDCAYHADT